MKKKSLVFLILVAFVVGTMFSTSAAEAGTSVTSLQKQIKTLKATVSKQKTQIAKKDKEISGYKKTVSSKDKEIKKYKSYAVNPLKTKIAYEGNVISGNYLIGTTSVPAIFDYKGIKYSPVNLVGELMDTKSIYNKKSDTVYLGTEPNGTFMSDILKPYFSSDYVSVNHSMLMGGQKYNKGYTMTFTNDSKFSLNLNGKYKNITGIIGIDDEGYKSDAIIEVYGDGNLISSIDLKADSLPFEMTLDVSDIKKLDFICNDNGSYSVVDFDFANMVIN